MFEHLLEIEISRLHKLVAYRSKERTQLSASAGIFIIAFNLESYDEFTMATLLI